MEQKPGALLTCLAFYAVREPLSALIKATESLPLIERIIDEGSSQQRKAMSDVLVRLILWAQNELTYKGYKGYLEELLKEIMEAFLKSRTRGPHSKEALKRTG